MPLAAVSVPRGVAKLTAEKRKYKFAAMRRAVFWYVIVHRDLNRTKFWTWCVLILFGLGWEVLQQFVDCLFYLLLVLFRLV